MSKISLEKYFVSLSKDSLIYGLGNAVLRILALLTAPIFTRVFVPAEYGIISLIATVISFLSIFLIFGMDNALFVSYYQYKRQKKEVISSAFWFLLLWGLTITALASVFSRNFSEIIFKTPIYRQLFLLTFATAYFTLLINLAKTVFRLEFRAKTFALISALNAFLSTGLMILLVVYFKKGLIGYFAGSLAGTFGSSLLALFLIRDSLQFRLSYPKLKEMLLFGVFIVPASLSFFVFDLSDRFFINHYWNLTELGLYAIGINIASLIVFFSYALGQAWSPQVMKMYFSSKKVFHQFVPRFFVYYLLFFFILAAAISIFGQEILRIFATPKFYGASKVIAPLAMAMVFSSSNQVTAIGLMVARKTKYFAFYTFLAAILNLILNFALIPQYGMVGASWATAGSYLFLTVTYYWAGSRYIHLDIDWQKIFKLVLLSLVVILASPLSWRFGFGVNLLVKIAEMMILPMLFYFFGVIEKQEINYLKIFLKRFLRIAK